MFFGRHRTYNVRYRQKTYDVVRFLQVLAILTYDIVYDIVRFLTMSHTMCSVTSVLYDIERKVPMSLAHIAKTYDIALRRRMQDRSIRYAISSIRYACLGRRQARRDVLAMPLQLPRVLFPDPRPCRMVCIAQAQCRSPFPQSGTGRCGQCGWRLPCMSKNRNCQCSGSLDHTQVTVMEGDC